MRSKAAAALCLLVALLLVACSGVAPAATQVPPTHPATEASGSSGVCLPAAEGAGECAQATAEGAGETATLWVKPSTTATPTVTHTATPTDTATPEPATGAGLIAFDTLRDGNAEVYLLSTTTGVLTNLTRNPAEDRAPDWHPDGAAIAFESHRDGNWDVYRLDLTSAAVTRLTDSLAYDGAPAWSPDGKRIAFESYRDGNLEVYTMASDGSDVQRMTEDGAGDYGPAWSPDGSAIAFTSWRNGNKEVYLVPAGGGEARNLTNHPADDEEPTWAPDGKSIAFVSWRDVGDEGHRNAEVYRIALDGSGTERLSSSPWPDLDPAIDLEGHLVWAAYDPGPTFETYDPFRPGDYHLYRIDLSGAERLTETGWDDRRPDPAPAQVADMARLSALLLPLPPTATPQPALAAGSLAKVIEVPGILALKDGPPILVNELVAPSLLAWQQDVLGATGFDFLHETLGSWRNVDSVRKKAMYAYDYGFLSWHKTGRALDLALELKVDGADQLLLAREDLGGSVFWRLYLRTTKQDGSQGEPLKENPWLRWWWVVPQEDPEAYEQGGRRLPIPAGYYVDLTALAKRHGWERIASYAVEGDYHWQTDTNGTEYWHYERTDGLTWWQAMSQIYDSEALAENVGWLVGLKRAQTEEMMLSKGVPTPVP